MNDWTEIPKLHPITDVDSKGRVRRRARKVSGRILHNFIMEPCKSRSGYRYVPFTNEDGKQKNKYVHRLVAEAFIPNPNNKPFVNHLNGNKSDNRACNLEWVTTAENNKHVRDMGLMKNSIGQDHPQSAITDDIVREIRARIQNGESGISIAQHYEIHPSLVSHIKAGRKWGHVK